MVMCASKLIGFFCVLSSLAFADERVYSESENERRWNTPPKLTPEPADGKSNLDNESIQPRFLPFSASFSLSSGGLPNNAHSLSVGGGEDGISFSQSTSQAGGSSFGNKGISASQSSSFAAGLSGISASDSNSFSLNHPTFGDNSQANSNSFAVGQATSSAQGNVVNGQATSGAQSTVGSSHSSASSGASSSSGFSNSNGQDRRRDRPIWTNIAPNHEVGGLYNTNGGRPKLHVTQGNSGWMQKLPGRGPLRLDVSLGDDGWQHRRPEVFISNQRPSGYRGHRQGTSHAQKPWNYDQDGRPSGNRETWTQTPISGPSPGMWSQAPNNDKPGLQISGASASSSANSNAPGSSAQGHSSSHSSLGPNGLSSSTNNRVQTSGNAQSHAQAGAAAIGQNFHGDTQGSFSSGAIAGNSQGYGTSYGNAASGNRGENSRGQVISHATGNGFAQGTANSGTFNYVKFPGEENSQHIPREFVRNTPSKTRNDQQRRNSRTRDPVGEIITEITDTVADIFDI